MHFCRVPIKSLQRYSTQRKRSTRADHLAGAGPKLAQNSTELKNTSYPFKSVLVVVIGEGTIYFVLHTSEISMQNSFTLLKTEKFQEDKLTLLPCLEESPNSNRGSYSIKELTMNSKWPFFLLHRCACIHTLALLEQEISVAVQ